MGEKREFLKRKSFSEVEKLSYKEARKYYTSLRDIFHKQIKRLEKVYPEKARPYLKGGLEYMPTLGEHPSLKYLKGSNKEVLHRDLIMRIKLLTELTRRDNLGDLGGYEKPSILGIRAINKSKEKRLLFALRDAKTIKTLNEHGYSHITKSTLKNFGRFMDQMRQQYGKRLPNSEEMAEFFDSLKYNTKRKSTSFLVQLWEDYKNNDYEPDNGNVDLFAT